MTATQPNLPLSLSLCTEAINSWLLIRVSERSFVWMTNTFPAQSEAQSRWRQTLAKKWWNTHWIIFFLIEVEHCTASLLYRLPGLPSSTQLHLSENHSLRGNPFNLERKSYRSSFRYHQSTRPWLFHGNGASRSRLCAWATHEIVITIIHWWKLLLVEVMVLPQFLLIFCFLHLRWLVLLL